MKVSVSNISVKDRFRKELGDLEGLATSIAELGLLQPIGITQEGEPDQFRLVFGDRRLSAIRDVLGWTEVDVRILDLGRLIAKESAENELRKDFTPSERVAIMDAVSKEVDRRQGARSNFVQEIVRSQRPVDEAAERAGFGNRETARQAKAVSENASSTIIGAMDDGEVSIQRAYEMSKLPPEFQETLDKANAELERAKKDAAQSKKEKEKAEAEASAARTQSGTLKNEVRQLQDDREAHKVKAHEDAKRAAEEDITDLKRQLSALEKRHVDEVENLAAAKAGEKLAESADEVKRLNRVARERRDEVERLENRAKGLSGRIEEKQEVINRMSSADYEVEQTLKEVDEILRQQALLMVTLDDCERRDEHPDKLRSKISQLANQCGKLKEVLDGLYRPRLRVVDIEQ